MSADVVIFDNAAMTELLQSPDGLVGRDLQRRTLNVHALAVTNCPVDTGRLRSSLRWSIGHDEKGLVGLVGSDVLYADFQESGTRYMEGRHFLRDALEQAGGA